MNTINIGDLVYDPDYRVFGLVIETHVGINNSVHVEWHGREIYNETLEKAAIYFLKKELDKLRNTW